MGDDPRPAADVGQPAEHPTRGVDDVERPVEDVGQVVQVRAHEARVREAELGRRAIVASSTAAGEKSAPVTRAPSRAHDSVSIPKWHCRWSSDRARDIADELDLVAAQPDAAGPEALEVVEVTRRVDGGPGVPQGVVGGERPRHSGRSARHVRPQRSDQAKSTSADRSRGPAERDDLRRRARGSRASPRAAAGRAPPRRDRSSARRSRRAPRSGMRATAAIQAGSTRSIVRSSAVARVRRAPAARR